MEDRRVLATFTVTDLADAGPGTLRESILQANAAAGPDEIVFDASVAGGTVLLTGGELVISDALQITGSGETLDAGGNSRVMAVSDEDPGTQQEVAISQLTITGGQAAATVAGGGILNLERLTLDNVVLTGNQADFGGGLGNAGYASLSQSMVTNNVATFNGGGLYNTGAIATMVVDSTTISGNQADATGTPYLAQGGGIFNNNSATLMLSNSSLTGNAAVSIDDGTGSPGAGLGGGLQNDNGATATLSGTDVVANTASFAGGVSNDDGGVMAITGGLIDGNTAQFNGGGVYNSSDARLDMQSVTISGNSATNNVAGNAFGGGLFNNSATVTVTDSTLTGNRAVHVDTPGNNFSGLGGNVVNAGAGTATFSGGEVLDGVADFRGGGFQLYDYSVTSLDGVTVSGNQATGEIGGNILFGGQSLSVADSTISGGSATRGGALYAFDGGSVTITDSDITDNTATEFGGGVNVAPGADVTLDGVTMTGNTVDAASGLPWGGAIFVAGAANSGVTQLTVRHAIIAGNSVPGRGGAISSLPLGTATSGEPTTTWFTTLIEDSEISGNSAGEDGGAIHVARGGALTVVRSTLSGNVSGSGGGAINSFGYGVATPVNLVDSTLDRNSAVYGGGIAGNQYVDGNTQFTSSPSVVTLTRSTISHAPEGGGIDVTQSTLELHESTISGNTHTLDGAGLGLFVFVGYGGTLTYSATLGGSTITDNSSGGAAGGVYGSYYGQLNLHRTIVSGNTAALGFDDLYQNYSPNIAAAYSLIGDNAGVTLAEAQTPDANGNLIGSSAGAGIIDAQLDTLADNGGPTLTHLPMAGSPVIDAGDPTLAAGSGLWDQRGAERVWDAGANVAGGIVDIGAVEYLSPVPTGAVDGDFNDDGIYDCADIDALVAVVAGGSHDPAFDLTGDALVTLDDVDAWRAEAGAANLDTAAPYAVGDANLSGVVDVSDFNLWSNNKFTSIASWCSGDFNADGVVDVSDFNLWSNNKFTSQGNPIAASHPTPSRGAVAGAKLAAHRLQPLSWSAANRPGRLIRPTRFGQPLADGVSQPATAALPARTGARLTPAAAAPAGERLPAPAVPAPAPADSVEQPQDAAQAEKTVAAAEDAAQPPAALHFAAARARRLAAITEGRLRMAELSRPRLVAEIFAEFDKLESVSSWPAITER